MKTHMLILALLAICLVGCEEGANFSGNPYNDYQTYIALTGDNRTNPGDDTAMGEAAALLTSIAGNYSGTGENEYTGETMDEGIALLASLAGNYSGTGENEYAGETENGADIENTFHSPEPGSLLLFGSGLLGIAGYAIAKMKRKKH